MDKFDRAKCKSEEGTIDFQVLNVVALLLSHLLVVNYFIPLAVKIFYLFCVSQNNFLAAADVDPVDDVVFVLYLNRMFILRYLFLKGIVCCTIRFIFSTMHLLRRGFKRKDNEMIATWYFCKTDQNLIFLHEHFHNVA